MSMSVFAAQSCLTLCDPMECSPTRLLRPWNSPGKNTGVGCHVLPPGESSRPSDGTWVSCTGRRIFCFNHCVTREAADPEYLSPIFISFPFLLLRAGRWADRQWEGAYYCLVSLFPRISMNTWLSPESQGCTRIHLLQ